MRWGVMFPNFEPGEKIFLEGSAGSGKTTLATHWLRSILDSGVEPERIMVLIPQATYGRPYQLTLSEAGVSGGNVQITTLAGLARKEIGTYWPIVA